MITAHSSSFATDVFFRSIFGVSRMTVNDCRVFYVPILSYSSPLFPDFETQKGTTRRAEKKISSIRLEKAVVLMNRQLSYSTVTYRCQKR